MDNALKQNLLSSFIALLFAVVLAQSSQAALEVDITRGKVEPLPIAIAPFSSNARISETAQRMVEVINADLERSGLFRPLNSNSFLEQISDPARSPRFADWQVIKAKALLTGSLTTAAGGKITAQVHLWDVFAGQSLEAKRYSASGKSWRRIAHIIADMIYERLTGEKGYFDTRIAFIDETGPKEKRIKRLAVMDQDGAGVRYLTNGTTLVLTPRFSPNGREIAYMSFGDEGPRVYMMDLQSGRSRIAGSFPGITYAPRFSPDGSKIVMSLQNEGNANIYMIDLKSGQTRRLTRSSSIDTSPSFSPDGTQFVFESDRGGSQQLYVMNLSTGKARRITYSKGRFSTPVWSPRGDIIAFTKQASGRFVIGVVRPDGSGERILTNGVFDEGPTWSPNGRVIMYFRDDLNSGSGARLWSVDITGQNERPVPTPSFGSDPSWSPLRR